MWILHVVEDKIKNVNINTESVDWRSLRLGQERENGE